MRHWTTNVVAGAVMAGVGAACASRTASLKAEIQSLRTELSRARQAAEPKMADLTQRRHALNLHDNVVQQLVTAKLALEMGHEQLGMSALGRGLDTSKGIITTLLEDPHTSAATATPGGLRLERQTAA